MLSIWTSLKILSFGTELTIYHIIQCLNNPEKESFRKHWKEENMLVTNISTFSNKVFYLSEYIEDIYFFSVKDRNLFHRVDTISNIFTRGCADGVHEMK